MLPFPGYSWYFTQHAVGLEPKTLYGLLACASMAQGMSHPGEVVNRLIVENGILTENIRAGQVDAWRDYQQILAELGLIYSTKVRRELTLTPAGEMFLAGEVGFSELMTSQALRYQYPNGQKSIIQSRLRSELSQAGYVIPESMIELMFVCDVCVKPGLLILRILLELENDFGFSRLSLDECGNHLVKIKKNIQWMDGYNGIIQERRSGVSQRLLDSNIRRNIGDWFKFLGKTDLFVLIDDGVSLTSYARNNRDLLISYCSASEASESFWYPKSYNPIDKDSWFSYFGDIPLLQQMMVAPEEITQEYIASNYVGGTEDDENEDCSCGIDYNVNAPMVNLSSFGESQGNASQSAENVSGILNAQSWDGFVRGIIKRKAKTDLHHSIVGELARYFSQQGASVYEDRDSVDLLVKWAEDCEGIFEVKTVNKKTLQSRLRLAIGQLEEYAYRRSVNVNSYPEKIVVINKKIQETSWQVSFLTEHLNIGLICKERGEYYSYVPSESSTGNNWNHVIIA